MLPGRFGRLRCREILQ